MTTHQVTKETQSQVASLGSIASVTRGMKWFVFVHTTTGRWRCLKASTGYVDAFGISAQCDRPNIVLCSKLTRGELEERLNPNPPVKGSRQRAA